MQTIIRLFFSICAVLAIGLAIWFSITLISFFLLAGGVVVICFAARKFLVEKGILNPIPGVPMDATNPDANARITVIETNFTHIEDEKK